MKCSSCDRPLDFAAEGLYVCCAGASRRWRCAACNAEHEGFAFAYGACPSCGGRLLSADASAVDDGARAGVRMAFEIELGGRAFYQRAAAETCDPQMRELFIRFALMEGEHMETLARRYHVPHVPLVAHPLRLDLAALFGGVEHRPQDPDNLFRIAIAIEQRAARLFAEHADRADCTSPDAELFRELAAEEAEHALHLGNEHARWRAGRTARIAQSVRVSEVAGATQAPINAAELLLGGHDPEMPALECGEQRLTRGALRGWAARCAAVWAARGLRPGDRVAIKLPDGLDWVAAFLGSLWGGMVAVAVNPRIPAAEWRYILDEAGFSVILAEHDGDTPDPWRSRLMRVDDWRRACEFSAAADVLPMDPEAPAFWCHSSGTSGQPKAVVHAHRFAAHVEQVSRDGLGLRSGDRVFASSKLFFAYPQTNALFAGLRLGATVILDPLWPTAAGVAATVAALRPSVLFSVPSLYRNLLHDDALAQQITHAGVRLCVSAGEALPAQLREQWQARTGLPMVDGYGASETLVLVMLARDGTRGFEPSPGVDVQPLDDVPIGVPTRLRIRAPTLALGYLDRPLAQSEAFREGAFCPADLWQRTAGGGWQFAGREDSLVKIRGRWVNLVALAEQLAAHAPCVLEGAAVCVPDADGVDSVAYFYVPSDAARALEALQARAQTLPHHQRPRWLHAIDSLPRGPTGKLLRRKLQELHERFAPMQPCSPAAEMGHPLPPAERGFQHE
ncbi:MAG: AMP-binding protein [Burkholderiaceae bacterium]|nr:AMP-binding protein [Burkholderiaceae bacterium]